MFKDIFYLGGEEAQSHLKITIKLAKSVNFYVTMWLLGWDWAQHEYERRIDYLQSNLSHIHVLVTWVILTLHDVHSQNVLELSATRWFWVAAVSLLKYWLRSITNRVFFCPHSERSQNASQLKVPVPCRWAQSLEMCFKKKKRAEKKISSTSSTKLERSLRFVLLHEEPRLLLMMRKVRRGCRPFSSVSIHQSNQSKLQTFFKHENSNIFSC